MDELTDSIVHALIDRWPNPAFVAASQHDLGYFERGIVAYSKLTEFALFVQVIYRAERWLERYTPIRGMQVKYVDRVRLQIPE